MNKTPISIAGQGQPDPQADAMKQAFENARDGFVSDPQKSGDVEQPSDPELKPTPPYSADHDLKALNDLESAKLDLSMRDGVALEKDQDFDFGR